MTVNCLQLHLQPHYVLDLIQLTWTVIKLRMFRSHLRDCIENHYIIPFPGCGEKRQDPEICQVMSIYCICRQPEGGKMAECTVVTVGSGTTTPRGMCGAPRQYT